MTPALVCGLRPQAAGRRQSGFTLLELLVVIVIIGILAGAATLSLGLATGARGAQGEAERLRRLLVLAGAEAVARGRAVGLVGERTGYRFVEEDGRRWQPIEGDSLLRPRGVPPGLALVVPRADRSEGRPAAVFHPDGTAEPADIRILEQGRLSAVLRVDQFAGVELERPTAPP